MGGGGGNGYAVPQKDDHSLGVGFLLPGVVSLSFQMR